MRVTRRHRRAGQRGQILVIVSLLAIVLFGVMAISVDVGLLTNDQKTLQYMGDTAATSGAMELPCQDTTPANCTAAIQSSAQTQASSDALYTVQQNMQYAVPFSSSNPNPAWSGWTGWQVANLPASDPTCSGYCGLVQNASAGTTMWVSSPPEPIPAADSSGTCFTNALQTGPRNAAYDGDSHYIELDICQTQHNNFASLLGQPNSIVSSHSIAYHNGPPGPSGWALYANVQLQFGNQAEQITGDTYVGQVYQVGQSGNGQTNFAALCAETLADGSGGHVVLGPTVYTNLQGSTHSSFWSAACPGSGNGSIFAQAAPDTCPGGAAWQTGWSNGACVTPTDLGPPLIASPTATPAPSGGSICGSADAATAGVYVVDGNTCPGGISFTGSETTLSCVSFILKNGAQVNFTMPNLTISSAASSGCTDPEAGDQQANSVFWAAPSDSAVTVNFNKSGGQSNYVVDGTIYIPGGTSTVANKAPVTINGQAIVNNWQDQSGNHPNVTVNYTPTNLPQVLEADKLVE